MAVASWKGSVSIGLLQFGVKAYAVDREIKFAFNGHHVACGGRVSQQPMWCAACDREVPKDEGVRGYQGVPGIDEAYLDSLEAAKSSLMELDGLVPADQIEPRFFRRSYDLVPDPGAEKLYVLFRRMLESTARVAVGKVVMGNREQIVAVRPRAGVLAMELLWWPEELKADSSAREAIAGIEPNERELAMGMQLAEALSIDFEPSAYRNEYAEQVGAYLTAFVAGAQPPVQTAAPALPKGMLDLEAALAATLASLRPEKPAAKKGRAA